MRRAKNAAERGFDSYDIQRLAKAMGGLKEVRSFRRVQAVLLVAQGRAVPEVAEIVGVRPWAVYAWVRKYLQTHHPDNLGDAPRPGRPRAAPTITKARIEQEIRRDPMRLGYNSTGWTVALLADHLRQKYGSPIKVRTLRRRMHDLGLRWKRPRYIYATKDPHRAQKKGAWFAG
jgi:transposase